MMERPPLTIKVRENEIKMNYTLQMDLQCMVPNAETAIETILSDPYTRDYIVRRVLTPSRKALKDEKDLIQMEDVELDMDETLAILDWVAEHLLYFFAKSAVNLRRQADVIKAALPQSESSTDGSVLSAS